ncbi:hypothetical protein D5S17_04415 [Pseudonocardiaceae bacterium YIM PH 21723]|nr:hypothetical protein D5S17_04415 [Pseudonocardiaceae bacterium YIM PH 21723]
MITMMRCAAAVLAGIALTMGMALPAAADAGEPGFGAYVGSPDMCPTYQTVQRQNYVFKRLPDGFAIDYGSGIIRNRAGVPVAVPGAPIRVTGTFTPYGPETFHFCLTYWPDVWVYADSINGFR